MSQSQTVLHIASRKSKILNPMQIKSYAAQVCQIDYCDIKRNSRATKYVNARKLIAFKAWQLGYTHLKIADMIGRKEDDPYYLINKVKDHLTTKDPDFMKIYNVFQLMCN